MADVQRKVSRGISRRARRVPQHPPRARAEPAPPSASHPHDGLPPQPADLPQSREERASHAAQPYMGQRHHLHNDRRFQRTVGLPLRVPDHRDGRLQQTHPGLVRGPDTGGRLLHPCAEDGRWHTAGRLFRHPHPPLRPRHTVRQRRLHQSAERQQNHPQYDRGREPEGQRHGRAHQQHRQERVAIRKDIQQYQAGD